MDVGRGPVMQRLAPLPLLPGPDAFGSLPQQDAYPPPLHQHQPTGPLMMRPPPLAQSTPYHHHHHVHRHPGMEISPGENVHVNMGFHSEGERNEPPPLFARPYSVYEGFDETVVPGTAAGNWGKKLQRTSRNTRKRKIGLFGPYSAEAQVEERARKRIKALLPPEDPPSPPLLSIPGIRDFSPPASPHLPPKDLDPFPSLTALVATGGLRNSFTPALLDDLGRMTMDLVESEGEGCRSLGRLFSLLAEKTGPDHSAPEEEPRDKMAVDRDRSRRPSPPLGLDLDLGIKEEPETPLGATFPHGVNGQASRHDGRSPSEGLMFDGVPIPAYTDLFITPGLTLHEPLRVGDQETFYPSTAMQLAAMSGWLLQIRGVYDDLREYMSQLQQVSVGLAEVDMGRQRVWNALRAEVGSELDITLEDHVNARTEEEVDDV